MSWIEAMACGVPKILGNTEGIGGKININKIGEEESVVDLIKRSETKKDEKDIKRLGLNWGNHVNKLLKVWE